MNPVLRAIDRKIVEDLGYRSGSDAEDFAVRRIHRSSRARVTQQYRVGRFRLDFAWPDLRVAIEVDGLYHNGAEAAFRDAQRDRELRSRGWVILRVSAYSEEELLEAVRIVNALLCRWP